MYEFRKEKIRDFMFDTKHNTKSLEREFLLKGVSVNSRTISRWVSPKGESEPKACVLRVLIDIAQEHDKKIKFEDFYVKRWQGNDKIG